MMMCSPTADRLHPAPDAMDSETANLLLLRGSDDSLYPPSSSVDEDSLTSSFWPAGIASLTIQTPDTASSKRTKARLSSSTAATAAARSRWMSTEFCVYYVVVAFYLWKIVQAPVRLSQGEWRGIRWWWQRHTEPTIQSLSSLLSAPRRE